MSASRQGEGVASKSVGMTSLVEDGGQAFGAFEHRIGMSAAMWISLATFAAAFIVFWGGWHGHGRIAALRGVYDLQYTYEKPLQ